MRRIIGIIAARIGIRRYTFIFLLISVGAARLCAAGFEDVEQKISEHILSNGMKFIILERHEAPVFSGHIYVNVGAADEVIGNTGIYLAHGAAIDPSDGTLYMTDYESNLYTVNKTNAAATLVGPIGFPQIGALDFDPCTGVLYGAHEPSRVFRSPGYLTPATMTGVSSFW